MKVYLVYSASYGWMLKEEVEKVLFCYPYVREECKGLSPEIPYGFSDVIIDSGGYQLQTGVAFVSIEAYALWLEFLLPKHPEISGYMNLDILGDDEKSFNNLRFLESKGLHPIPVWHAGEQEAYLDYFCNTYPWVSIGGLVSGGASKGNIRRLTLWLRQQYPKTNFHLFGIGISGIDAFKEIPPYSCDFSTWNTVQRFGHTIIKDKNQVIKEVQMPEKDRLRIRTDHAFRDEVTRHAIKNMMYFEDTINSFKDSSYQQLLV